MSEDGTSGGLRTMDVMMIFIGLMAAVCLASLACAFGFGGFAGTVAGLLICQFGFLAVLFYTLYLLDKNGLSRRRYFVIVEDRRERE